MKTTTILGILLVVSLSVNFWLWLEMDDREDETECHVTRGFEAPTTLSTDRARVFALEYKSSITDPDIIEGGIISRTAFDRILCAEDCNAISYTFARDAEGTTGPEGRGVFVIFSGLNVQFDSETNRIIDYKDLGIEKYIPRHWCPPTCNPY